ncbi:MAG TPA: M48 family metallopeptidase [Microvirga sp.]|jgi:heat shock protein HtpX|nr:M48 family metallopeptidase [Microvirga sp.]
MFQAFGLTTHIQSNRRRSVLLLAGLFLLVYLLTFALALLERGLGLGLSGGAGDTLPETLVLAWGDLLRLLPWVSLAAAAWVALAYRAHGLLIDLVTGARGIERRDDPRLYHLLESLCIARGLTVPRLKIIETDAPNAFASGLNQRQYTITVTRGLLDRLDDREVEAVLAHELTHIRNEDVRLMVVAGVIAGIVTMTGELVFRGLDGGRWRLGSGGSSGGSSSSKRKGGGAAGAVIVALLVIAVAWALSLILRFALMRSREFLADAGAVELTKNPDALISALRKIEGKGEIDGVPSSVMEMCLDNPRSGFADLLSSHPTIPERIDALARFAGGQAPAVPAPVPADPLGAPVATAT